MKLSGAQRAEARSLVEDSGWSRKEALAWVQAFPPDAPKDPDCVCGHPMSRHRDRGGSRGRGICEVLIDQDEYEYCECAQYQESTND